MAVGYKLPDGRDMDSVFLTTNSGSQTVNYKDSSGNDLGKRYVAGSIGVTTGYKNASGTDLGYLFGNGATAHVSSIVRDFGKHCEGNEHTTYIPCKVTCYDITFSSGALYTTGAYSLQILSITQGSGSVTCRGSGWGDGTCNSSRTITVTLGKSINIGSRPCTVYINGTAFSATLYTYGDTTPSLVGVDFSSYSGKAISIAVVVS